MAGLSYDLYDPVILADPYPTYREMRETAPVAQLGPWHWRLTRYADVSSVLQDPRTSAVRPSVPPELLPEEIRDAATLLRKHFDLWMAMMDPPDHSRLRKLVAEAFTPSVVERLRTRIEQLVDELLAPAREARRMDVVLELAYPLPTRVIAELIGLPPADAEQFKRWSNDIAAAIVDEPRAPERVERQRLGAESLRATTAYLESLIADRRGRLRDDLLSGLIGAEEESDRLSTDELIATCVHLLFGGYETTTHLIGNGLLALLSNPDELHRLGTDVSLLPSAVEEMLRYDCPVQLTGRRALADLEVGGETVPAGSWVTLMIGAANRDPAVFHEPDRFDVGARQAKHLSFSLGPHYCLGAALARLEAQIAFRKIVWQLPDLELTDEPLRWRSNPVFRGLESLPVSFAS